MTVNVTRKEIPAVTFKTIPELKPVVFTRIVNQIDTIKTTIWRTVNDTVFVDVDCPDVVSSDTTRTITNEKTIKKERTMFGKRLTALFWFAIVSGIILLLLQIFKK